MEKIKQVQLKIEEDLAKTTIWITSKLGNKADLTNKIWSVLLEKSTDGLMHSSSCGLFMFLKPNETRETIIQSLWELQKIFLPVDYYILYTEEGKMDSIINIIDENTGKILCNFYDPADRVITITSFDDLGEG